jgi:hypothetical protein
MRPPRQLTRIAIQQARIVFDQNMIEIFEEDLDNQFVKLGMELAAKTETVRLQSWWPLGGDRMGESFDRLNALKAHLEQHVSDRFTRHIQNCETRCGTVRCCSRARVHTRDNYLGKTLYES